MLSLPLPLLLLLMYALMLFSLLPLMTRFVGLASQGAVCTA